MVGFEMFKKRQHVQAFEYFLAMAKKHADYSGVLGMLVANLAPQQPDAARVKQFTDTADKKPDSALDNFLAGVAAHYSAHYKARTKEAKRALYETAITYLKRARPAFDFEPRIFIYLSVSHYRLGHQEKAEALIEQAVELNRQDPDAFYCRAEVYHRSRPDRALKDIDRYLELTKVEGGVSSGKYNLVQRMRAYLVRVQKGEEEMTELWDPLIGDSYQVPEEASVFTDSKRGLMSLVGLAVAILLLSLLVYLIRKKLKQDSVS
jgi:tetratricopeptide (TPR) repeat protein